MRIDTSGWKPRLATKLVVLAHRAMRWNVLDYLSGTDSPPVWRSLDPPGPEPGTGTEQKDSSAPAVLGRSLRSALGLKLKLPGGAEVELNALSLHAIDSVRVKLVLVG